MKKFFHPAVALMNQLKYQHKFMLISLLFVLPLALVMLLLIPSINERIDFTQKEQAGNAYLRPLRQLLVHSLQNKLLAHNYLRSGHNFLKEALLGNQARLDEDFKALETINRELGDTLKATESFNAVQANWQDLKGKTVQLEVSVSDELHDEFIADIRALISLVGNTSHLILDPDLDSYYLMDVMLLKLPENQELLAQTRFLGERAITQKSLTAEEREQLIVLAGLVQSNLKAIQNGMGVAFGNNLAQNLKPILSGPLQEFSLTTEAFLETLQRELIAPPIINSQSAYELYPAAASQALTASFNLGDQITVELDGLLQARIDGFIQRKYLVGIVTALGLGLASYLWVGFYLAVMQTVSSLDDAANRMVNGNSSQMVQLENQDELRQMATSFNQIAAALTKAQTELEQRIEARTVELSRTNERLKTEIVERQQVEIALRESEEQLRLALEAAQMGIWNWNILSGAVTWSPQVEAIFGLAAGEFAGRYESYLDLVYPADRAIVEQNIAETLAGRADYHIEHRLIWPDGSLHWLEARGRVYRDETGQPVHMTGTVVDITARKQVETALQASEAFLHNIYTGVGTAIFVIDVTADGDFRYVGVNPAYEQLVGLKSADLEGRTPDDMIPVIGVEAAAEVRRNYEACLQANQIIYKENHVVWQGKEIWYLDQLTPIHDTAGRITRIIGSTLDTTQIKQAERALSRYADRLEVLHAIDRAILAVHSAEEIGRTALRYLRQLIPCQRAALNLLDFETDEITILAVDTENEPRPEAGRRLPFKGNQHIIDELGQGNVFVHTDIHSLPDGDVLFEEGIRAGISLPLITNEALIGAVNLWSDKPDSFSEEHLSIAREVADQLAIAIQQARLFEAEAQRRQEAEALRDTASALNSTLNLDEVLDRILSNAGRIVQHQMVNIALIESGFTHVVRAQGYAEHGREEAVLKSQHSLSDTPLLRRMVETGQPVVIPDTQTDPDWVVKDELWLRAYIGVPICLQREVIGILNLDSDTPGVFTAADAERLQAFADQSASAIQNARLYAKSEQHAERLRVLHEIDRAILVAQSPDEIARIALRHIRRLVPCRRAVVSVFDFAANEILTLAIDVDTEIKMKVGSRMPLELYKNLISELKQGKVISVHVDTLPDTLPPEIIEAALAEGTHFGTLLPLIAQGELIGSVNLWEADLTVYSVEQIDIVREVADQLAIAIQQARLFEAEARRRQEAEALSDTAAALNSTLNLEEVLDRIMANVGRVVPHEEAKVTLIEADVARVIRSWSYANQAPLETTHLPNFALAEISTLRRIIETGQPLVIFDTHTYPDWLDLPQTRWIRSYVGVPIRIGEEVIGFLNLDSSIPRYFSVTQAERLQTFADQVALAIKNARLFAETKQRAEHLAVLHELDQAITASLDADHVYRAFAQQTLRLLPYDCMSINLVEGDSLSVTYAAGEEFLGPVASSMSLKMLEIARWVIEQGQPFLSTDLVSEQRFATYQPVIMMGMRSAMMLPLRVKGQVIGVWFLARRQVEGYGPDDLAMAQSVAEQLAIAIENVRLFEQVQGYTEELEQRVADRTHELSALYDVTAVASESLDLSTTLERSLERVLAAMRSQAGTIHLVDETDETLHLVVQQGLSPEMLAQLALMPIDESLPGLVIRHGEPWIVPDLASEPRSALANRANFQAYVGVPMRASGLVLGVLGVARARQQPQFNVEEVALLTTIADQVGVVVESARLRQLAEHSAVMEERARLARDLHDSVTQLLYSVNLFATVGREAYNLGDMAQVNSCLAELGQIAQQALKEMRLLVYELRPLALAQEGLVGALRQRLDAVERRTGIQAELQAEGLFNLPGRVEEALYHIAQEALNNALKHAAATTVTISLAASDGRIELEVADNGSGFDPQTVKDKGGLGLTSMRERVAKLGGGLTILSTPGQGTKIKVKLEV